MDRLRSFTIQVSSRFVSHDAFRFGDHCSGDGCSLTLPTGKLPGLVFHPACQPHLVQYIPSLVEISIIVGSLAMFVSLFLVFVKIFPSVSIYEVKETMDEPGADAADGGAAEWQTR